MKRHAIALIIPASLLAASIVSRGLIAHAPASISTDLAQPIPVVTNWGTYGALLLGVLFVALIVAMVAYVALLRFALRRRPLARAAQGDTGDTGIAFVIAVSVLSIACAWGMPVIFSSDVYAYAAYGELARLGADPYAHAALARGNPVFDAAIWQWGNPPPTCVYGPPFVAIAEGTVAALRSFGTAVQLDGLRAIASLALPLCALLAYVAYPGERAQRAAAAAAIGLNPVAVWCVAEGHNDALALAVVLGGYALARSGWLAIGAAVAALSGSIKLPGIAAALPLALAHRRAWIGAAAGAIAAVLVSVPLLESFATHLAPHGRYAPQASFEAIFKPLALVMVNGDATASILTWTIAALAGIVCAIPGIVLIRRGERAGWAYVALAGWLLVPNPYPWYAVWLLPIVAVAARTNAGTALAWLSVAALLRYVPDAVSAPTPVEAVALGLGATLPYAALFGRKRPDIIDRLP